MERQKYIKLSEYARIKGLPLRTAQRHASQGLIDGAQKTATGRFRILMPVSEIPDQPLTTKDLLIDIRARLVRIEARLDEQAI